LAQAPSIYSAQCDDSGREIDDDCADDDAQAVFWWFMLHTSAH